MNPGDPPTYPKRVLIAVTGESPQVVTETIFALSQLPKPFLPTQVIIVTTGLGAQRAGEALVSSSGARGQIAELCAQYHMPFIDFSRASIRVSTDPQGRATQDAQTETELVRMGDLILKTLCEFAPDPLAAIHLSLAGGRKTMSYYAGQAMSLVGRPQDRLSHVILSDRRFESSPDFYFPPKRPVPISVYDKSIGARQMVSTADVAVHIADVPFLRLRELLGRHAPAEPGTAKPLSEMIAEANTVLQDPGDALVGIDTHEGRVFCNEVPVPFTQVELAFYYALAALAEDDRGLTRRASDDECLEYLELRSHITTEGATLRKRGLYEATVGDAFDSLFGVKDFLAPTRLSDLKDPAERRTLLKRRADVLNPQFTNVNKRLIETLGAFKAQRFLCISSGRPNAAYFFADGAQIKWLDRRPRRDY